ERGGVWRSRRSVGWLGVGWGFGAVAFAAGALNAVAAGVTSTDGPAAFRAGAALVAVAALLVPAALLSRVAVLPDVAGGIVTGAVVVAAGNVAFTAYPRLVTVLVPAAVAAVALAARALPHRARPGPRVGALVAAGLTGVVVAARALVAGAETVGAALPAWRA